MILWHDPWYAADLTTKHQTGWKKKRQLRDVLQTTSLNGEAAWQSDMQHCCISS